MQNERTVRHPTKDDVLQMLPRDAFPTPMGISDNDPESRENAGAETRGIYCLLDIRSKQSARGPHGRAAGRVLPARINDVDLQAHRTAEDSRHKDRETSVCQ